MVTRPVKQGDLDNFCGIYSIINAVSHLYHFSLNRKVLYLKLVNQFNKQHDIMDLVNSGMSNVEMDSLLESVLEKGYYKQNYPIEITTPYRCVTKLTTPQLFKQINRFLNKYSDNRTSVIIGTQYHWSVIEAIDNKFIYFLDSSDFNKAYRRNFSLVNQSKTYQLQLDDIYFLERKDDD